MKVLLLSLLLLCGCSNYKEALTEAQDEDVDCTQNGVCVDPPLNLLLYDIDEGYEFALDPKFGVIQVLVQDEDSVAVNQRIDDDKAMYLQLYSQVDANNYVVPIQTNRPSHWQDPTWVYEINHTSSFTAAAQAIANSDEGGTVEGTLTIE